MNLPVIFLMVLGLVMFIIATWKAYRTEPPPASSWAGLVSFGLFCWLLADIILKYPLLTKSG